MKRFFQAVERDGSFKKLASRKVEESPEPVDDAAVPATESVERRGPAKFLSWNANSLLLRLKQNSKEVMGLLQRLDPDVIAIQEVRMPAAGRKGENKNQGEMKDDTAAARGDRQTIMNALSVLPLADYRVWWSLAESKYGGTALFVKRCFKPLSVRFSLNENGPAGKHEADGRVILAEFESFRFLNTYVPNNGWKEEESSFLRRREWDRRMLKFVARPSKKPLIWCGDLNVSQKDADVSHPDFFANAKLAGYAPPNAEDCGQPGFTAGERRRFSEMLAQCETIPVPACVSKSARKVYLRCAMNVRGKLVDTYRWLNKEKQDDASFTWSGNPVGKFRGKLMRLDYFLISESLVSQLVSSNILGHGIEQEGYCGSDHCPISMELDWNLCAQAQLPASGKFGCC